MLNLTGGTWLRFVIWMTLGLVVYFVYGRSHSRVGLRARADSGSTPGASSVG